MRRQEALTSLVVIFIFVAGSLTTAQEIQPVKLDWKMSDLIKSCEGPSDEAGKHWYEFDFNDSTWQPVTLRHHINTLSPVDRFYRGFFTLDFVPVAAEISFQSDDGLWVYTNGVFIGHWGGDCYHASCINLSPCSVQIWVNPQPINSQYLRKGTNVIAVHVTNWAGPWGMTFNLTLKAGGVLLGDVNGDGRVNVADPIYLLSYLFSSGSPPVTDEVAEVNCDEKVNIADAVYLIYHLFAQGPEPGCP